MKQSLAVGGPSQARSGSGNQSNRRVSTFDLDVDQRATLRTHRGARVREGGGHRTSPHRWCVARTCAGGGLVGPRGRERQRGQVVPGRGKRHAHARMRTRTRMRMRMRGMRTRIELSCTTRGSRQRSSTGRQRAARVPACSWCAGAGRRSWAWWRARRSWACQSRFGRISAPFPPAVAHELLLISLTAAIE